ncbi:MAG: hypothetical protein M1822_009519 [Bathelium mastoideum]|nr:MAG: hypothetical protein M1822_009519 [Bathelium mastoideum]
MTLNETTYNEDKGTYTILGNELTAGGSITVFPRCYSTATLPFEPNCTTTATYNTSCEDCLIYGGEVKLMYFPVTVNTSIDICSASKRPITTCPFGPTTAPFSTVDSPYVNNPCNYAPINETLPPDSGPYAVVDNVTLWANKVYLSLATVYAAGTCGYVGAQHTSTIIALKSSDIYSVYGYHHEFVDAAYSFNFNDLNTPMPAAAYPYFPDGPCSAPIQDWMWPNAVNGVQDDTGPCWTIVQDLVSQTLAVPPQLRSIDPRWANCALDLGGLYDPPQALTPYAIAAGPGMRTATTTTTTLKPGPTAQPVTGPTATARPPRPPATPTRDPGSGRPTPTGDPGSEKPAPTGDPGSEKPAPTGDPESEGPAPTTSTVLGSSGDPSSGLHPGSEPSAPSGSDSRSPGNGGNTGSSSDPRNSHSSGGITSIIAGGGGNSNLGGGIASILAAGGGNSGSSPDIETRSSSGADSEPDNPVAGGNSGSYSGSSATGFRAGLHAGGGIASILGGVSKSSGLGSVSGSSDVGDSLGARPSSSGSGADPGAGAGSSSGSNSGASTSGSTLSNAGASLGPEASAGLESVGSASGSRFAALNLESSGTKSVEGLGSASSGSSMFGSNGLGSGGGSGAGQTGAVFSAGGRAFTATPIPSSNGGVIVDGQAISPGGAAATLSNGQVVSAAPSGIVVGSPGSPGSSIAFSNIGSESGAGAGTAADIGAVFTAGGQIFRAVSSGSAVIIDSQTLTVDGAAKTLPDGQVISAGSAGLVIGEGAGVTTAAFSSILGAESAVASSEAVLILGGAAVTANEGSSGIVVIDGQTLSSGGSAITIDGTVISAAKSGIVIGGTNGHNTTADFFAAPTESPSNNGSPATATKSGAACLRARSYVGAFVVVFLGLMMVV